MGEFRKRRLSYRLGDGFRRRSLPEVAVIIAKSDIDAEKFFHKEKTNKLIMDMEKIKEFIKPTHKKGMVFTAILVFGIFGMANHVPFTSEIIFLIPLMKYLEIGPLFGTILYLLILVIYWQFLASVIIYVYEKIIKKK